MKDSSMPHTLPSFGFSKPTSASLTLAKQLANVPMVRDLFNPNSAKHANLLRGVKNPIPDSVYRQAKQLHDLATEGTTEWDAKITLG